MEAELAVSGLGRTIGAALAAACVTIAAAGCTIGDDGGAATDTAETFGYQVAAELQTTNAGSLEGATSQAEVLSGRLYPGVYVPGPQGQMIPNTDLVETQELPGPERRVNYMLSDDAVFSDGTPVTCSDFLLTFTAGTNPAIFGSAMPLFDDTADLTCTPGAKNFTVIFKEGRGARWRGLFDAGTVLPAHAVAGKLDLTLEEFTEALEAGDYATLRAVADVWRTGFNLDAFDPELQVSFGPYAIAEVREDGAVTLVANEYFYGDAPQEHELTVWPGSADTARLAESGALKVADLRDTTPDWYDVNAEDNRVAVTAMVGELTEMLTFPEIGVWGIPENRQALSRCLDPRAVAEASSRVAGVEVPVAPYHVVKHDDPLAKRLDGVAQPQLDVDIAAASVLAGMEVRVGYPYESERFAAMVEAMRASCEPAGVTVVDAGGGKSLADLPRVEYGEWGEEVWTEGTVDAVLRAVDPMSEFPAAPNRSQDVGVLRSQEHFLWNMSPSIPLAAQPVAFAIDRNVGNVVPYTGLSGIGWNMNRWQLNP